MQLDNQKEIAEMQNETQKEIAGIQSATSRQNTKDQVYAQNEMLAYQQKESTARVASIMENTNLSKQQQVSEIMRQMLTQAQTAGQYFTNDQIKEMTRKVSAEVDLVHQQTQNQRISTLSQSPMLGFHKQMDNRIKLLEEILSFRMQGVEFDNGDMYVDGHKAASDVRDEFVSVTEKLM